MRVPTVRDAADEIVLTHLDDLQSEVEAGSRALGTIAERATRIREGLVARRVEQAALAGSLVRQIAELQTSMAQQLERLADLRRVLRDQRALRDHRSSR
jgi:hypothetical protein